MLDKDQSSPVSKPVPANVLEYKKRLLLWANPVEFVNNMYGTHPGEDTDFFEAVFGK